MEEFLKKVADLPIRDTYIVMKETGQALSGGTNIASRYLIRPCSSHHSVALTTPVPLMTVAGDFHLRQDNILLDVVIETLATCQVWRMTDGASSESYFYVFINMLRLRTSCPGMTDRCSPFLRFFLLLLFMSFWFEKGILIAFDLQFEKTVLFL